MSRTLHEIAEQLRNSQTTNFPSLRDIADELDALAAQGGDQGEALDEVMEAFDQLCYMPSDKPHVCPTKVAAHDAWLLVREVRDRHIQLDGSS